MKRSNAEVLLHAFEIGLRVKIDGYTYALAEDGDLVLCIDWMRGPNVGHSIGLPFKEFMRLAESISDEQRSELAANIALNEISRSRGKTRAQEEP